MKALTIWQPWATLIIAGVKPYEFRGWTAPPAIRGQRIAIHAGARPVKKAEIADLIIRLRTPSEAWMTGLKPEALAMLERWHSNPAALPLSSIVGTAVLGQPKRAFEILDAFGVTINDSRRHEHANWAWPMLDILPQEPIQPAKGAQGFWDWRPD